eukprot:GFUD01038536.1.p1 GENE.GFUD01038536.1~~GFUD01038536.1.p1  ORF type:complete len:258 (-),score=63.02 GFUD01038536.1:171-944(-)
MSSTDSMLLSLPSEILSSILKFLSTSSVCKLERSSKTTEAAVMETNFWRKQAEILSKTYKSDFAKNLIVKVGKPVYVSGVIFKMIVRGSIKLDSMVEELESLMWKIRDDITEIANELYHDDLSESGENTCGACAESLFNKEWKLEIIPVEKKLEMAKLGKEFLVEGIADLKERFVHTIQGVELTLRKNCFEVRRAHQSEVEISIYCDVNVHNYPLAFYYEDGHNIWSIEGDCESIGSNDTVLESETSEDNDYDDDLD